MSTAIARNFQIGIDPTATNNFTLYQPATPDGTLRLGNGNTGITSSLLTLTSAGDLGIGTSSPKTRLQSTAGANLNAPSLGSATNAPFYLTNTDSNYGLLAGVNAGDGHVWLQAQRTDGTATAYNITLNEAGGNVGIGTSSPVLENGGGQVIYNATVPRLAFRNSTTGATAFDGTDLAGVNSDFYVFNREAGAVIVGTSGLERMRIDSSGNVGIGTSAPGGYRVRIVGTSGVPQFRAGTDTGSYLEMNGYDSNPFYCVVGGSSVTAGVFGTQATVPLLFLVANNERGRFDTGGRFLVGTTGSLDDNSRGQFLSTTHALQAQCNATDGGWYAFKCVRIGSTGKFVGFVYGNQSTEVGSISTGGTTTAYNTSSDYRLKHDIAPMTGALAKVAALKPVTYKWNVDGSDGEGFIAHELAEVCPDAVTGEKDAVDEDGNPKYQGIDTSFLVATLTAAIQELKAEFDAYKATHP